MPRWRRSKPPLATRSAAGFVISVVLLGILMFLVKGPLPLWEAFAMAFTVATLGVIIERLSRRRRR